ncbi:zinc finger protein 626-like isoform X2 [Musca domestica]|nr:zinc finger protein 626-like isoform X2 [Musca domestica]
MDIHSICRICLESLEDDNAYNLFLVAGLKKKLCMCTSLLVEENDKFPKNICKDCYDRLNDMADFQKLCADSVHRFEELVSRQIVTKFEPSPCELEGELSTDTPIEDVQMEEDENSSHFDPLLTNVSAKSKGVTASKRPQNPISECSVCHQKFKKIKNYEKHKQMHDIELPFQCEEENCKRGFTTAHGLSLHVERVHDDIVDRISCTQPGCDMKFPRRRILNWHLKRAHNIVMDVVSKGSKMHTCKECDKAFKCPMALNKHMMKHTNHELSSSCNYVCPYCGKTFDKSITCKMHEMTHTLGERKEKVKHLDEVKQRGDELQRTHQPECKSVLSSDLVSKQRESDPPAFEHQYGSNWINWSLNCDVNKCYTPQTDSR